MAYLIDRRFNSKNKSAVNRHRFLQRHRELIQRSVQERMRTRSITDTQTGEKISIPIRDTHEPTFHHGSGGRVTHVLPGNKQFVVGDKIAKPHQGRGEGSGTGASPDGESLDQFVFEITQQEFLDFLFEDMELPNLTKRQLAGLEDIKTRRAGYSYAGNPSNIDILRSMKAASSRRIALTASKKKQLRALEAELEALDDKADPSTAIRHELEQRIHELQRLIERIPYLDEFDIRYRRFEKLPVPRSQAVMFCLMDVSGSMDQASKDLAKRFFILLYLFLHRKYDKTEVVFIRHHTYAKEVDEKEFFYSRETGGTVVSTAIQLMGEIIAKRYPVSQWNIYAAQASDGDNWPDDNPVCIELLTEILPLLQYYAYIEITHQGSRQLWETYTEIQSSFPKLFAMRHIRGPADIYPVFHQLFRKQSS